MSKANPIAMHAFMFCTVLVCGCTGSGLKPCESSPDVIVFSEHLARVDVHTGEDLQVVRLLRYRNRIVAPVLVRDLPRRFVTGVKQVPRPERIVQFLGAGQLFIHLPVDEGITGYIFLVRPLGAVEWRVFERAANSLAPMPERILFPEVDGMPTLASRKDGGTLLELVGLAERERAAMSRQEK